MNTRSFSCYHDQFHKELEKWKKFVKENSLPVNGIYKLTTSIPILRKGGSDIEGILYIGEGDIFGNPGSRPGLLINAINKTAPYHDAGNRYLLIKDKYPLSSLSLSIELMSNSKEVEKELLTIYKKKFGELPPLNLI